MKTIIKKQPKIGNLYKKLLYLYLILILISVSTTVSSYYNSCDMLTYFPKKPVFLYIVKWIYSFIMIIGILRIKKQPNLGWVLLNSVSVCVLLQWYVSFQYYAGFFDMFLLELISLALIITTNRKSFLDAYSIERVLKARSEISKC